ncbi:uncharacterized protein si:ch211-227n13.3 isoform X2 [Polyodon spathula]|nr:uncharacterized protein si:ch211-227n13.3 isoform X2 [Polyodon spathula]
MRSDAFNYSRLDDRTDQGRLLSRRANKEAAAAATAEAVCYSPILLPVRRLWTEGSNSTLSLNSSSCSSSQGSRSNLSVNIETENQAQQGSEVSMHLGKTDEHSAWRARSPAVLPVEVICILDDDDDDDDEYEYEQEGESKDENDNTLCDEDDCLSVHSGLSDAANSLCTQCLELYWRMRSEIKPVSKTIDYDPSSLSCDEWVLLKRRLPRRFPRTRGKLWNVLRKVRNRKERQGQSACDGNQKERCCWPHVFLQRNLLRCTRKEKFAKGKHAKKKIGRSPSSKVKFKRAKQEEQSDLIYEIIEVKEDHREPGEERKTLGDPLLIQDSDEDNKVRRTQSSDLAKYNRPARFTGPPSASRSARRVTERDTGRRGTRKEGSESLFKSKPPAPSSQPTSSGNFSWLRTGGFRSMLAKLEAPQTTVVKEIW